MSGESSASIHFIMKTPILYVCYTPNLILRKADQGQEAQPVPGLLQHFPTLQTPENYVMISCDFVRVMLDAGICAVSLEPKIGMMGEERESAAGSSDLGQAKEHRRRNDI